MVRGRRSGRGTPISGHTSWRRRDEFPEAVEDIVAAYRAAGYPVEVDTRTATFARLYLADAGERHRVDLVATWRTRPPVPMEVGPVLHPDDVMAGKVVALNNRAAARDFLDVDAAITSGRYTLAQLCDLAETADPEFDRTGFAHMLGHIEHFGGEDVVEYGVDAAELAALRARVGGWREQLSRRP